MAWTFIKTTLLIGVLTGILFAIAYLLGLSPIMALGFAALMNFIVYWFSDSFVLEWVVLEGSQKTRYLGFTRH